MNKQELIKKYEDLFEKLYEFPIVAINRVIADLKKLDEPQKVTVPQFVADWIKYCKFTSVDLYHALEMGDLYFGNYANQKDDLKLKEFFETENNQDLFARAWLDGYEVGQKKRYLVKLKGINSESEYLYYGNGSRTWRFREKNESGYFRKNHTRKELEEAGFGEVFDSPLFEVEEVEDEL